MPPDSITVNKKRASLSSLPTELHEHILSFLPFDTLFLASKTLPLWHSIFTTRLLASTEYTPPCNYNIPGTHQIFYGQNSDFTCLVQKGIIHKIYLNYDTGFKLDITNDPILNSKFFRSAEDRDVIYPCVSIVPDPTRRRRTRRKTNPYILPKEKELGYYQISPTVYHLDEISTRDTIKRVAEALARGHRWELPQGLSMKRYWMEIGPGVRNRRGLPYRQGLEAFFRGEVKGELIV
ncbi:hypothetical protein TWF569_007261 [Orbilia oligospora]|uniref:Uncharacterized protein n=1 Tax=Orbilia oligospora TaxID=2813651 RepID=A0A7C8J577_ORBOL|nr:hypothetical protein TWF102_009403 [Orbilia oligospora]KAF3094376.1 hypothetical protein TWF103_010572 [Orbilia oligospora]KAF3143642.1 hypothetical protein TWF569_007261 [Orbilia oligospora]